MARCPQHAFLELHEGTLWWSQWPFITPHPIQQLIRPRWRREQALQWMLHLQIPWGALVHIEFMIPVFVPAPVAALVGHRVQQPIVHHPGNTWGPHNTRRHHSSSSSNPLQPCHKDAQRHHSLTGRPSSAQPTQVISHM
jgi:hypothetical protein